MFRQTENAMGPTPLKSVFVMQTKADTQVRVKIHHKSRKEKKNITGGCSKYTSLPSILSPGLKKKQSHVTTAKNKGVKPFNLDFLGLEFKLRNFKNYNLV